MTTETGITAKDIVGMVERIFGRCPQCDCLMRAGLERIVGAMAISVGPVFGTQIAQMRRVTVEWHCPQCAYQEIR